MSSKFYSFLIIAILALMCVVTGCSDFDEMKSQRALLKAEALMEQGREEDAMQALSDMITMFPATNAGELAQKHLVKINRQRERRERMAFTRILDSYRQVLNGYYSLYSEYPRVLSDMEENGYFFDAAYLEEVTPAGYTVFLWLKEDGSGYRLWSTNEGKNKGYSLGSESYTYTAFETQAQLGKLQERFVADSWNSPLVLLRGK